MTIPDELSAAQLVWVTETLRLYQRYQVEVVEALDLCPWAKGARLAGRVRYWVCLQEHVEPQVVVAQLGRWTQDSNVEIGLMLLPRLRLGREELERFSSACMAADAARHSLTSPQFVTAAFHPDATPNLESAERLIPFLRRTPDPTLQAVRVSALERVRRNEATGTQFIDPSKLDLTTLKPGGPSLRERIARTNLQTVERLGAPHVAAHLQAIADERAEMRPRLPVLSDHEARLVLDSEDLAQVSSAK
jgi:hypothetical protein